jgi:hypothetical protein
MGKFAKGMARKKGRSSSKVSKPFEKGSGTIGGISPDRMHCLASCACFI